MRRRNDCPNSPQSNTPSKTASSSAFSDNALPNEDWTQITDLTERRRIQNRIAQRNYRKKLKQRMENQEKEERSAGSRRSSGELSPVMVADQAQQRLQTPTSLDVAGNVLSNHQLASHSFHQFPSNQLPSSPPEIPSSTMPFNENFAYPEYPAHASYYSVTNPYEPLHYSQGFDQDTISPHHLTPAGSRAFPVGSAGFPSQNTSYAVVTNTQATASLYQTPMNIPPAQTYGFTYPEHQCFCRPEDIQRYGHKNCTRP